MDNHTSVNFVMFLSKKYIIMNNLGNIWMLWKISQYDNQSPNLFNSREVFIRATNSQVFESENNCTEISPKYQSGNAETIC